MKRTIKLKFIKCVTSLLGVLEIFLIFITLAICPDVILAQTFDQDSAMLTNVYLPMKSGDKLTYNSYGLVDLWYYSMEAINKEEIDQVKCLRVKVSMFSSLSPSSAYIYYYWLAQDTAGNVWILQYQDVNFNDLQYYGRNNAKLCMPSTIKVGTMLWDSTEVVVAVGVTVPKLGTGLGPYYNCIKSKIDYGGGDIDYLYYAPNVGEVKEEWNDDGGINGLELSSNKSRPTSTFLPFLQLLLE